MKAKEIRKSAREAMSGKWGRFVEINLLLFAISILAVIVAFLPMIISMGSILIDSYSGNTIDDSAALGMVGSLGITYLLYIILILFIVPLAYAFLENLIKLKRDNNTKCTEFLGLIFKRFGRAWKVGLWCVLKILVIYLMFIAGLVAYIILTSIFAALKVGILIVILSILSIIGMIVFYVAIIVRFISLALSQYIAIDNPDYLAKQCVDKSIELMKGYKWKYVCLSLSFIGWMLLSILTLGIGFIFLYPYMQVSYICFYEKICEEKGVVITEKE